MKSLLYCKYFPLGGDSQGHKQGQNWASAGQGSWTNRSPRQKLWDQTKTSAGSSNRNQLPSLDCFSACPVVFQRGKSENSMKFHIHIETAILLILKEKLLLKKMWAFWGSFPIDLLPYLLVIFKSGSTHTNNLEPRTLPILQHHIPVLAQYLFLISNHKLL
jgi:hypothetical protein